MEENGEKKKKEEEEKREERADDVKDRTVPEEFTVRDERTQK